MHGLAAVVLLLVAVSSGCRHVGQWATNGFKVGPDYMQPAAPVAHQWIDFNDPRVISASCGVGDGAHWWTAYGDPQIDYLVHVAYHQNLPLKEAGIRVLEAQSQRAIAVGLLFPQSQEAYFDYNRIQISKNGAPNGLAQLVPVRAFDYWNTGFNMSWELDVWGKIRRSIEAQNAHLDAEVENYDDVLVTLIGETVRAYLEIREYQQRLIYARQNIAIQNESLRIAEARLKAGRTDALDVAQAKATLYYTEANVPVLETGLRLANNRLCILLGTPPHDMEQMLGIAPIPLPPPQVVVGIPAELLRRRPDVRKAEREVAVQSARIGVATSLLFPAFSVDGNLSWQSEKLSNLFDPASAAGLVQPGVNWQILNYGRIAHLIELQDAKFQRSAVHYQQVVLEAGRETEDAIKSFLEAQERVIILQSSVRETERAVGLSLTKWEKAPPAQADYNRVANLQTALVTQQDQLATSQARIGIELAKIYKALGGGWQLRLEQCSDAAWQAMPPLMPELMNELPPETIDPPPAAPEDRPAPDDTLPPMDGAPSGPEALRLLESDFIVFPAQPARNAPPSREQRNSEPVRVDVRVINNDVTIRRLPGAAPSFSTAERRPEVRR